MGKFKVKMLLDTIEKLFSEEFSFFFISAFIPTNAVTSRNNKAKKSLIRTSSGFPEINYIILSIKSEIVNIIPLNIIMAFGNFR